MLSIKKYDTILVNYKKITLKATKKQRGSQRTTQNFKTIFIQTTASHLVETTKQPLLRVLLLYLLEHSQ